MGPYQRLILADLLVRTVYQPGEVMVPDLEYAASCTASCPGFLRSISNEVRFSSPAEYAKGHAAGTKE